VVEIGDVDAHSRLTRVLQPLARLVRERAVPVVDIDDVVRNAVVGDVDVGPAIAVQIGDRDAEPVAGIAQDPGMIRHVRELAMAVVVVKLVVTARSSPTHPARMTGYTSRKIL